jgi:hypothetical protein
MISISALRRNIHSPVMASLSDEDPSEGGGTGSFDGITFYP